VVNRLLGKLADAHLQVGGVDLPSCWRWLWACCACWCLGLGMSLGLGLGLGLGLSLSPGSRLRLLLQAALPRLQPPGCRSTLLQIQSKDEQRAHAPTA
jgi:hypothetical protein